MNTTRRPRASSEQKRQRLLDVTEEIMLRKGYAAVSSRSVATQAGINAPLVHYYFPTLDDLFIAVLQRRADPNADRLAEVLDSESPLVSWWDLASDQRGAALFIELLAAANHRPALREQVGDVARRVRKAQIDRLVLLLPEYGIDTAEITPNLAAAAMQGIAFGIAQDISAGYDTDPEQAAATMRRLLVKLEEQRRSRGSLDRPSDR